MSTRDLTGRWEGIFNYPRQLPPTGYVAVLVERGGVLTGEIEEVGDGPEHGTPLIALVEGERVGISVRFRKRYADPSRAHYTVRYDGTLSAEGDEITGEWTIPGIWSGTFIMVRAAGVPTAVSSGTLATAADDAPALTPQAADGGSTSPPRSPPCP